MESLQMIILISASFMVILALLGRYISLEGVKAPGVCGDVVDQAALDDIFFNDNKFAN